MTSPFFHHETTYARPQATRAAAQGQWQQSQHWQRTGRLRQGGHTAPNPHAGAAHLARSPYSTDASGFAVHRPPQPSQHATLQPYRLEHAHMGQGGAVWWGSDPVQQQRQQPQPTGWEHMGNQEPPSRYKAQVWQADDQSYPEAHSDRHWSAAEQRAQGQSACMLHVNGGNVLHDATYGGQSRQHLQALQHMGPGGLHAHSRQHAQQMLPAHLGPTFQEIGPYAQPSHYAMPRRRQQQQQPAQGQMYGGVWQGEYDYEEPYMGSAQPAQPYMDDPHPAGRGQLHPPQAFQAADDYPVPMRTNQVCTVCPALSLLLKCTVRRNA